MITLVLKVSRAIAIGSYRTAIFLWLAALLNERDCLLLPYWVPSCRCLQRMPWGMPSCHLDDLDDLDDDLDDGQDDGLDDDLDDDLEGRQYPWSSTC